MARRAKTMRLRWLAGVLLLALPYYWGAFLLNGR